MTKRINLHLLAQSHHSRPHLRLHLELGAVQVHLTLWLPTCSSATPPNSPKEQQKSTRGSLQGPPYLCGACVTPKTVLAAEDPERGPTEEALALQTQAHACATPVFRGHPEEITQARC